MAPVSFNMKHSMSRGVGAGWTGVMSTPLLPEVVPEIDANPVSFTRQEGDWGITINWGLGSLQKYGEWSKFAASVGH